MYNREMVDEMRICIICLRSDKKLRQIDKRLSEYHDIISDFNLNILEPRYCFECEHLLRRAYIFHRKCVKAVKVYNDWQRKEQADKEPIDVIHTLLPLPFQSSLGPWIPSSPNVQFALYTETLSEVTSQTPLTKLHPETLPQKNQPTNSTITKRTTLCLNEGNIQLKDIPTNVKQYQPDSTKVKLMDFNMSLSVNALEFPSKLNTKLTDINQEFNKKQPIVLAQRLTMDTLGPKIKVNQKTMDILLKTKSLESGRKSDLNISNEHKINNDNKTENNDVDSENYDIKIAEDEGCLLYDFLDDDILNDDINDINSDVEIDTEVGKDTDCGKDDTNDDLNKIYDDFDSVQSENERHGDLDCVQSEMEKKNNDFDIDASDEDILLSNDFDDIDESDEDILSSVESSDNDDMKLIKVHSSKTKGIGRRKLNRRSLLAGIKAKFKASGELKSKDGTKLDKEYILRCLQDRAPDAIWYRLDLRLRRKFSHLTYGAIDALYFVQRWYKTNDSIPNCEIEYLNTEGKVRAEFRRRKYYECYKQAKFKCEICYRPFRYQMSLDSHMKYHNTDNKDDYVCSICKWRHKKRNRFMLHRRNHEALYKCKICIMRTYYRPDMFYHAEKHLGATYACQFCDAVYKWKSHLGKHMALVHPRSFVCTVCGDAYRTSDRLEEHRLKHQGEEVNSADAVKCDKCDLSFPTEKVYKKHYYISHKPTAYHRKYSVRKKSGSLKTGEKRARKKRKPLSEKERRSRQMKCRVCGAVGVCYSWLAYHFKAEHPTEDINVIYADKKPHLCEACGKGFSSKYSLRDHMNRHLGVRPYACPDCPKRFYSALNLKTHSLLHLPGEHHMCNICGELFHSKKRLCTHERIHTQDRLYKCNLCSKTYLHATSLKEHTLGVHYNMKRIKKPKAKNNEVKGVIEGPIETISDAIGVETVEAENIWLDLKDDKSEWGEEAVYEAAINDGVIPGRLMKGVRVWSDAKGVKRGRSDATFEESAAGFVTKSSRGKGVKRVRTDLYIDEDEGIRDDLIGELTEETDGDEVTYRWASDVSFIKEVTRHQPKYTVVRVKRGESAGTSSKGVRRGKKKVNVDWDKRRRVSTVYEYSE